MPAKLSPVLLVARNNRMRERLEQTLASKGIEVLATSSPTRGLKTLRLAEPQVLLVEYADKGIPGFIDIAKEENPSLRVIVIEDDSPRKPPLRPEVIKALMADGYRRLPSDTEYLISDIKRAAEASVAPEEELELPPAFSPTEVVETPESSASAENTEPVEEFDASSVLPEEVTMNEEEDDVPFSFDDLIEADDAGEDEGEDEDAGAWAADPYALFRNSPLAVEDEDYLEEEDPESAYGQSPYVIGRTPRLNLNTYGLDDDDDDDEPQGESDDEDYLEEEEGDPESAWGLDPYAVGEDEDFDRETYGLDDDDDDGDDYSDSMPKDIRKLLGLDPDDFELVDLDDSELVAPAKTPSHKKDFRNPFRPERLETEVEPRPTKRPREVYLGQDPERKKPGLVEEDLRYWRDRRHKENLDRVMPGWDQPVSEERLHQAISDLNVPSGKNYSEFARSLSKPIPASQVRKPFMRPGRSSPLDTVVRSRRDQEPREVFYGKDMYGRDPEALAEIDLAPRRKEWEQRRLRDLVSDLDVPAGKDYSDFDLLIEDPVEYDPSEGERGYMPSPFESKMPLQRPGYQAPTRVIHRDSPPPLRGVPPKLPSLPPPGGYLSEQMAAQRAKRLPPFPPPTYRQELEARRMRPSPSSGPGGDYSSLVSDLDNFNVMARRASWMTPARRTAHKATRTAQATAKSKRAPETAFQRKETPTAVFVGGSGKPERPMTLKQAFSCLDLKLQARSGDYVVGCVSCEGDLFKKLGSHQIHHLVRTYVQAQVNAQPGSPFGGMGRVHVTKIDPKKKCAYFRFASHYAGHLPYKTFENDD